MLTTPAGDVSVTCRSPRHVWLAVKSTSTCSITKFDSAADTKMVSLTPTGLSSGTDRLTVLVTGTTNVSGGTVAQPAASSAAACASSCPNPYFSLCGYG